MYSISELADELNRKEWAVERMLTNRGYLKQNGDPRKSTINDGLMDEDGSITEDGWSTFIDELGYKDSGNDEDEDEDEDEDDDDDDELDEDEIEEKIRDYFSEHTEPFIEKALEAPGREYFNWDEIEVYAYQELDDDDCMDDIECVLGVCDAANEFMRQEFSTCFEPDRYWEFFDYIRLYDEAYQKGMEHYNDEAKAKEYAESCARRGEITDFDDSFEDCARNNEPWLCISADGDGPFSKDEEYDADLLIDCYYEW